MGVLNSAQKQIMILAGFIVKEINHFDNAKTIDGTKKWNLDFNNDAFQSMIKHRADWVATLRRLHWTDGQIVAQIRSYYVGHASKRTAFDMLQIENSPAARYKRLSDSDVAVKLIKRTRVSRTFGKPYGRKMSPVLVPRYIPKPKRLPGL
jgi:hypothetical protein